jgi:hypothetical protein
LSKDFSYIYLGHCEIFVLDSVYLLYLLDVESGLSVSSAASHTFREVTLEAKQSSGYTHRSHRFCSNIQEMGTFLPHCGARSPITMPSISGLHLSLPIFMTSSVATFHPHPVAGCPYACNFSLFTCPQSTSLSGWCLAIAIQDVGKLAMDFFSNACLPCRRSDCKTNLYTEFKV